MRLQVQNKSYLVLQAIESDKDGVCQYICRLSEEVDGREYRAVRIPSSKVTGELIQYLMEQVRQKNFREFINYTTESDSVTILMNCGKGITLEEKIAKERLALRERLELSRGLLSHLVLSDFPAYFLYSAMEIDRIRVTPAMEFSFAFELSDIAYFSRIDMTKALFKLGQVLEFLFSQELKQRSLPELESFLYGMKRGQFSDLLSVYEGFEEICRIRAGREEEPLENHSFPFRLWEWIKWLGRKLKSMIKLGILILAMIYLGLSIYQFVRPESWGPSYDVIGDLELKK